MRWSAAGTLAALSEQLVPQNNTSHAIDPARTSGTSPPTEEEELKALLALLEDFAAFAARQYMAGQLDRLPGDDDGGDE